MSNVSKFSARSGRMLREDGSVINAADVLDMVAKGQLKVQLDGDSIVIDNVDIGAEIGIKDGENKLKVNADGSIDTKLTGSIVKDIGIQSRTTLTAGTFKRKDIVLSDDVEYFVLSARQYNSTEPLTYDFMFSWLGYTAPGFMMDLPLFHSGTRGITSEKVDALNERFEFRISNGSD